jgi:beta-1,4-mannosyltransferase
MPFQDLSSPTYSRLNLPTLRADRPALLVSSTSWTPDEDFSILIEALCLYEKRARHLNATEREEEKHEATNGKRLPKILVILTGKGPLKDKYMNDVNVLQNGGNGGDGAWEWVRCISMWLEAEDYPLLLGLFHPSCDRPS